MDRQTDLQGGGDFSRLILGLSLGKTAGLISLTELFFTRVFYQFFDIGIFRHLLALLALHRFDSPGLPIQRDHHCVLKTSHLLIFRVV